MGHCKIRRIRIVTENFIVVETAEQAVDLLAELHERATGALSKALKRYLKDRVEPDADQRALFRYPELRLNYQCQGEVPLTTRQGPVAGQLQRDRDPPGRFPQILARTTRAVDERFHDYRGSRRQ